MPHQFWLIRAGQVALDIDVPGGRRIILETLGRGELVGLSWFLPPFPWQFGAIATQSTEAFEFDAATVLRCCNEDPAFGYELTRRVLTATAHRLQSTRSRLLEASAHLASGYLRSQPVGLRPGPAAGSRSLKPRARSARPSGLIISSTRASAARCWSRIHLASRWPDPVSRSRISRRLAAVAPGQQPRRLQPVAQAAGGRGGGTQHPGQPGHVQVIRGGRWRAARGPGQAEASCRVPRWPAARPRAGPPARPPHAAGPPGRLPGDHGACPGAGGDVPPGTAAS